MHPPRTAPEFRRWQVSDDYQIRGRVWRPTTDAPSLGIIYLHGIQSHGGWFEWSAARLAESGYPVLLSDRRGSGMNESARGDTPSVARWLDDLDELSDWLRAEYGPRRLAVVGVSWGGKLATAWALRRPERVERLLLIAPGLFPAVDVGFSDRMRIAASLFTRPARPFPIPLDDPALFTDDPAARAFIAGDRLKLTHATARFLYESSRLDRGLRRAAPASLVADCTLVLAGRDRIIRNEPTAEWLERVAARPPRLRRLSEAAHTIEFEPDVAPFERVLSKWILG